MADNYGLPASYDRWRTGGNSVTWPCGHRGIESDGGCDCEDQYDDRLEELETELKELNDQLETALRRGNAQEVERLTARIHDTEVAAEDLEQEREDQRSTDDDNFREPDEYDDYDPDDDRADYAYDPYGYD